MMVNDLKEVILIKEGEIFLKGLNKTNFEARLIKNIKKSLQNLGNFKIVKAQSTLTIFPEEGFCFDIAIKKIAKIFGIAAFCKAFAIKKDFDEIKNKVILLFKEDLNGCKTFKVVSKRSDKNFVFSSPQICEKLGEYILEKFDNLTVELKKPDVTVNVEIRDYFAFIYCKKQEGAKGMPVASAGGAMLLLSGGIDSPVAGWMMAKRGLKIHAIHFISPPYTGQRALDKVKELALILSDWVGSLPFHIVNVTKLQEELKKNCPENLFTILLRRAMMKISQEVAKDQNKKGFASINALITGESLNQVASQTTGALNCTDCVCDFVVLRPLIGMDKEQIIAIADKINTFKTSILPYEDCCTVFTPKHPKTNPKLEEIKKAEEKVDLDFLIKDCLQNVEFILIKKN